MSHPKGKVPNGWLTAPQAPAPVEAANPKPLDDDRKPVRLTFVPEMSEIPANIRLRKLLKLALRTFGLRCVRVEDVRVEDQNQPN
jgi:hypothetical protein